MFDTWTWYNVAYFCPMLQGTYNKYVPPIIFGVFSLVAGLAAIALPETSGRQLPETILDAENFGR